MTPDRWRQIEDLYHAARNRGPGERAVLLENTDPEIRSRVERMLEVQSGSLLIDQPFDAFIAESARTTLAPGTELGPYRIEEQIGAGGMGTVYRAVDTRLDRVVAIKIASERYSEQFLREARAISTLNHPHVCTLYDVGPNYLVMEFIEGSTLAAELRRGPLAPEVVVRYGAQIADALAEAHALGIVHRDLKPGNIMITRRGVKVLDFGLAKVALDDGQEPALSKSVMGTPAYMAPEQLEGKPVDARSDLFALGLVLFEMTAGQLPFPGTSLANTLLGGESLSVPQLSHSRPGTPAGLSALVTRLLETDLQKRVQSAVDVRDQLQRIGAGPRSRTRDIILGAACVILLIAVGLWISRGFLQSPTIGQVTSVTRITTYPGDELEPALSPDGSKVAFSWTGDTGENRDIYVMQIGGQAPLRLTHDLSEDNYPAWSPDGKRIAFLHRTGESLWDVDVVSTAGGGERKLSETALDMRDLGDSHPLLTWSADGKQLVFTAARPQDERTQLLVLTLETGLARRLDLGGRSSTDGDSAPAISPDGRWLAFRRYIGPNNGKLMAQRLRPGLEPDGAPMVVPGAPTDPTSPCWSPDSRSLIFAGRRQLFQWRIGGAVRPIYAATLSLDGFTIGWPAGHLRAVAAGRSNTPNIWSLPLDSTAHKASGPAAHRLISSASDNSMRFSPDGKRFAFVSTRSGGEEVWIANRDGTNLKQLTRLDASVAGYPRWSADGKYIAFHARIPDVPQLYIVNPDEGLPRRITNIPSGLLSPAWMPDGQHLLAWQILNGRDRVFRVRVADGAAEELFQGSVPVPSLDGKRILYGKIAQSGIFARAAEGDPLRNPEQLLVDDFRSATSGGLAPVPNGIYYLGFSPRGDPLDFRYFDYATHRVSDLAPAPTGMAYGLTVAPDERELLYSAATDPSGDDLIMLEFQ